MSQLQQIEVNRVNRLQKSIEGMLSNLKGFGNAVQSVSEVLVERSREINANNEVKLFVENNKSPHSLPKEVTIEYYKSSTDLVKYREQLATRQLLQSVHITESEEGDD